MREGHPCLPAGRGSTPICSTSRSGNWVAFFIMYVVYIIYSPNLTRYYVGQTENLEDRLYRHRNSGSKSTKASRDWQLCYTEEFTERSGAVFRELEIKKWKSRIILNHCLKAGPRASRTAGAGRSSVRLRYAPRAARETGWLFLLCM